MNAAEHPDSTIRRTDHTRFSRPTEVVESAALPPEDKRLILLHWLEDEKALFVAEDEGMQADRQSQFDQVYRALRTLGMKT